MTHGAEDASTETLVPPAGLSHAVANASIAADATPAASLPPAVADALHAEEVARARGWSASVLVLCASALVFTPLLPSHSPVLPFVVALIALSMAAAWTLWRCRAERHYTPFVFRVFGVVAATASFEVVYFLGVFSPTTVVVTLGISFFGLGLDRRWALGIALYASGGYAVLATLVTAGVIADRGVIRTTGLPLPALLFGATMVPVVLLLTLWMARLSRRTMEAALLRSNEAIRLANQREALLAEANQNLEQALRAGAGQRGRFSGVAAGEWELDEIIGRGAMGDIYRARHRGSGEAAAVKLLREDSAVDERVLERFTREGQLAARLDAPNVVRIHATGRIGERVPFIAMELLVGEDLSRLLRRRRVLPPDELCDLARQVARGLDVAHEAGIVHRDLKPQNLFLAADGMWKILDFGVSTLVGSTGTLTQAAVVGTPGYMAPEQARSQQVDMRCDVFSLGAVVYRALTGRPPFSGAATPQILFDVVYRMPLRPSNVVDAAGEGVDAVLAIALAKAREDRFASAGELARALTSAFSGTHDRELRARAAALIAKHPWGR